MAKETTVIFVYDTELLKREEDDPNSAILYFYPTWVSDQQKTALCGQLMGTIRCLKSIFSMPKTVLLQTGKFFVIENGRYILAVGSDRNIPDWVLDYKANLIYSLVNFFHKDFINLADTYQNEALCAKLYHIFDIYLKLMLFGGNIFISHIPLLEMPKCGGTVFMEALAFLEKCRDFPNALGGTVLYHNKVVATHLSASITKKIVFIDPYRLKYPAEKVQSNFETPSDVQLLQVYITNKEFYSLVETSSSSRSILQHLSNKATNINGSLQNETPEINENKNLSPSLLKRDKSLLFTSVPEENTATTNEKSLDNGVIHRQNTKKRPRPNSLNLKSHNFDLNETKVNAKETPLNSSCGQSTVASTPMTEVKFFGHQQDLHSTDKKELSVNDFRKMSNSDRALETPNLEDPPCSCFKPNLSGDISKKKYIPYELNRKLSSRSQCPRHKKLPKRSSSLVDLSEVSARILSHPPQYSNCKNKLSFSPKRSIKLKRSNTIHDPTFPILKPDGLAASQYYFDRMSQYDLDKKIKSVKNNGKIYPKGLADISTDTKLRKVSKEHRKSLTLPLKPLNSTETQKNQRKYSLGVQLTPLMNKLTMLAYAEQTEVSKLSTLHSPYVLTPGKETTDFSFRRKDDKELLKKKDDDALHKCVLFVGGRQDTVLGLILKEECAEDRETIDKLWTLCIEHLPKIEKQINHCLKISQNKGGAHQDSEPYSFLSLDPQWDTIKRGGPWDNPDLNNLSRLHGDFIEHQNILEMYLRSPESVMYGHQLGSSEVFYQENATAAKGLLPPNDAIGLVKQKAQRRLERDHNIVLP